MTAQCKQTTVVLLHDPSTHYTYNDVVIVPLPVTSQLQVYPCLFWRLAVTYTIAYDAPQTSQLLYLYEVSRGPAGSPILQYT